MPLSSCRLGGRTSAQRPRHESLRERVERGKPLLVPGYEAGLAKNDNAPVVQGVVEGGTREDEAVKQRDRQAGGAARLEPAPGDPWAH